MYGFRNFQFVRKFIGGKWAREKAGGPWVSWRYSHAILTDEIWDLLSPAYEKESWP
jgi:hypothetical protein